MEEKFTKITNLLRNLTAALNFSLRIHSMPTFHAWTIGNVMFWKRSLAPSAKSNQNWYQFKPKIDKRRLPDLNPDVFFSIIIGFSVWFLRMDPKNERISFSQNRHRCSKRSRNRISGFPKFSCDFLLQNKACESRVKMPKSEWPAVQDLNLSDAKSSLARVMRACLVVPGEKSPLELSEIFGKKWPIFHVLSVAIQSLSLL